MAFADLEIRIFARRDGGYPVEMTLDGEQSLAQGMMSADIVPWVSSGDLAADGQRLFDLLLHDPALRAAWQKAAGQAPQRRIRLRLDTHAPELHLIPWELLRDEQGMLAACAATPFSRYLPIALPWGGAIEAHPLEVLVLIAAPDDLADYNLPPVQVTETWDALRQAVAEIPAGRLHLTRLAEPVSLAHLEQALQAHPYHALHIVAHGQFDAERQRAALYLQDANGHTQPVRDDELIGMLVRQRRRPGLIFLAACESARRTTADAFLGLAPKLVRAGVPAVVAMQDALSYASAQKLSAAFYSQLAQHGVVDESLNAARSTLLTAGRPDAAVPVLLMRLKSGRVWSAEADARGITEDAAFWRGLLNNIRRKVCIPIIGPRIHGRWLPTPNETVAHLARAYENPYFAHKRLSQVAQFIAGYNGVDSANGEILGVMRETLAQRLPRKWQPSDPANPALSLKELLAPVDWAELVAADPHEPHQILAQLDLPLYLTTNLDTFMLKALAADPQKNPALEVCHWNDILDEQPSKFDRPDYRPTPQNPLVYHLFGIDGQRGSMVLTEDSYLDFLVGTATKIDRIPIYLRGVLASGSLLLVGYSLHDLAFRVIMRGLIAPLDRRIRLKHVAVQLEEGDPQEIAALHKYLAEYFHAEDINVYWGSPAQFFAELREHLDL